MSPRPCIRDHETLPGNPHLGRITVVLMARLGAGRLEDTLNGSFQHSVELSIGLLG
jgi:hypothetical protein